jgi:hypothetical protein
MTDAPRAAGAALVLLLMTSIHHSHGAYVFDTPWRYHAVIVSVLAAAAILGSLHVARRPAGGIIRDIAFWAFAMVTLAVSVLYGAFEGGYNHVVKNALFFGGASSELMLRLFPPPAYEMPSDLFFEITGVLQVVPAAVAITHLARMLRRRRHDARRARTHNPLRQE